MGRLAPELFYRFTQSCPGKLDLTFAGAAVAMTPGKAYDWQAIFKDAGWLHISGITPALSRCAAGLVFQNTKKSLAYLRKKDYGTQLNLRRQN